jgi:lipopolysaccharide export system protein LptA
MKNEMKSWIWILVLGSVGTASLRGAENKFPETLRLVNADSLVSISKGREAVRVLSGRVRMVQGNAFLQCDEARWWEKKDQVMLTGDVSIFDGEHLLKADQVDYDSETKTETASGHVTVESGNRKISSDTLIYRQGESMVIASGRVKIEDLIEKATLTGEEGWYDRSLDYGIVKGHPQLVKVDTSAGKPVTVRGLRIEGWGREQRVLVSDSVSILRDDLKAVSQKAEYRANEERLCMVNSPIVWYQDQVMDGDTIDIQLYGIHFGGGTIRGRAKIISKDSTFEDVLKGRQIEVEVRDDTIRTVIVEGQAESLYHIVNKTDGTQGVNSVSGDRIVLTFTTGRLDRVQVESSPGQCAGAYTPEKENAKTIQQAEFLP